MNKSQNPLDTLIKGISTLNLSEIKPSASALNAITPTSELKIINSSLNVLNSSANNDINMTQPVSLPMEILKLIPQFNGEPRKFPAFLEACDLITGQFYDTKNNSFQNAVLVSSIKSRLTDAAEALILGQNLTTWPELRRCLCRAFQDQRDETSLLQTLIGLRQNHSESAQHFHKRCIEIRSLLLARIAIDATTPEIRNHNIQKYNDLTLKVYLTGLREPLGTIIRTRNPNNMETALSLIIEEENIRYLQGKPNTLQTTKQRGNIERPTMPMPQPRHAVQEKRTWNQPHFQRSGWHNFQNRPQSSRTNNPSFNQQKSANVFRPGANRAPLPKPTPMDTSSSNFTRRHPTTRQSNTQPNSFSEELFYQENDEQEQCDEQYYGQEFEDDPQSTYYEDQLATDEPDQQDFYNDVFPHPTT